MAFHAEASGGCERPVEELEHPVERSGREPVRVVVPGRQRRDRPRPHERAGDLGDLAGDVDDLDQLLGGARDAKGSR